MAVLFGGRAMEIDNLRTLPVNLLKGICRIIKNRDSKNQNLRAILCNFGKVLDKIFRPCLILYPIISWFIVQTIKPLLKLIKDQTSRVFFKHLLKERPWRKWLFLALKLAFVIFTFRMAVEEQIPKQRVLMVMDRFGYRHISFEHFHIF